MGTLRTAVEPLLCGEDPVEVDAVADRADNKHDVEQSLHLVEGVKASHTSLLWAIQDDRR